MNNYTCRLLMVALTLHAGAAVAQDAGSVSFATGSVSAERQPAEPLLKGDAVRVEDVVVTGDASRAQLLMVDDAKLAIRPNSRVGIAEYIYASEPSTPGSAVATSDDNSSVLNLVKGGFRTITGAIGSEDPADYEVRTAVGVLGIRGTDFALQFCNGDCQTAPGVTPGTVVADGLYIMVTDGDIFFTNEITTLELTAGDFAFIPLDTRIPARLDVAPPVLIDDSDFRFDDDLDGDGIPDQPEGDAPPAGFDAALGTRRTPDTSAPDSSAPDPADTEGSDDGSRETPAQGIRGIDQDGNEVDLTPGDAPDPRSRTIGFSTGPLGPANSAWSTAGDNAPGEARFDINGNLVGFNGGYPARTGADAASFDIGSAGNVESGFDPLTVMRWGRWAGGTINATLSDGTLVTQDLETQSLHWVSSPEWAVPPTMPIMGQASYSLIAATSPTDNLGNVGVLGSATFDANFTTMQVDSTLSLDINGSNWMAAGQGNFGAAAQLPAHLFSGTYGAVTIDGVTGGGGVFSGFFSEPGPTSNPAFPGGVGLTYSLQDMGATTTVSGAIVFGNP